MLFCNSKRKRINIKAIVPKDYKLFFIILTCPVFVKFNFLFSAPSFHTINPCKCYSLYIFWI